MFLIKAGDIIKSSISSVQYTVKKNTRINKYELDSGKLLVLLGKQGNSRKDYWKEKALKYIEIANNFKQDIHMHIYWPEEWIEQDEWYGVLCSQMKEDSMNRIHAYFDCDLVNEQDEEVPFSDCCEIALDLIEGLELLLDKNIHLNDAYDYVNKAYLEALIDTSIGGDVGNDLYYLASNLFYIFTGSLPFLNPWSLSCGGFEGEEDQKKQDIREHGRPIFVINYVGNSSTVYKRWLQLPLELRKLFIQTFEQGYFDLHNRVSIEKWKDCILHFRNRYEHCWCCKKEYVKETSEFFCPHCGCSLYKNDSLGDNPLCYLYSKYNERLLYNNFLLKSFLLDLMPNNKRLRNILLVYWQEGIPLRLCEEEKVTSLSYNQIINKMTNEYGIENSLACIGLDFWIQAILPEYSIRFFTYAISKMHFLVCLKDRIRPLVKSCSIYVSAKYDIEGLSKSLFFVPENNTIYMLLSNCMHEGKDELGCGINNYFSSNIKIYVEKKNEFIEESYDGVKMIYKAGDPIK